MATELIEVRTRADLNKFIKSQWNFYKNDKNFVPPIILDRKKLLDTKKNPFYKHSEIKLFMTTDNGKITGRIAGIINRLHNEIHNDKIGFLGFFECINDQSTANLLFEAAENYVKEKGCDGIRGPVNPSMNDETGLLIDGFDSPPVILMTYNPPYYIDLFENAGYKKAKDLYAYHIEDKFFRDEQFTRLQNLVRQRYNINIREVNFANKEQFKKDVETLKYIYNEAWQPNWGFVKMTDEEFNFLAKDLKQIAEPSLTIIAESKGKPVGFALALPDINQCLIYNKSGSALGALWHLMTKKKRINMIRIIVLGIIREYQQKGIDAVLYYELGIRGTKLGIHQAEASWVLEDNMMMNRGLTEKILANVYKKYRIYEKSFVL